METSPPVPGQKVPHLCHREHQEALGQKSLGALADESRCRSEGDHDDADHEKMEPCARHVRAPKRPFGLSNTPTKKSRCAYSGPAFGSILRPTSCTTPSA